MLVRGLLRRTAGAGSAAASALAHRTRVACVLSRGMAKDTKAADAKAGDAKAADAKKTDAKAAAAPKASDVAKVAVATIKGPAVFKGQRFAPGAVGPQAAVRSRFPRPPLPPKPAHPDDLLRWRIAAAAVVERIPLKAADPTPLEAEMQAMRDAAAARVIPRYKPPVAAPKKSTSSAAAAAASSASSTAAVEDEGEGDGPGWGNDEVDEDEAQNRRRELEEALERDPVRRAAIDADVRNIRRKRSERVYLIVKKPRSDHAWQFPQGAYDAAQDANSLRNTAERELLEECSAASDALGVGLHVHSMGNFPVAHYRYKFTPAVAKTTKFDGASVFFHQMLYLEGDVALDSRELADYAWATKHEIVTQYFTHSPELVAIAQQLLK